MSRKTETMVLLGLSVLLAARVAAQAPSSTQKETPQKAPQAASKQAPQAAPQKAPQQPMSGVGAAPAPQEAIPTDIPTDKAGWIERLGSLTLMNGNDINVFARFMQADPELIYAVVRDGWPKWTSSALKTNMVYMACLDNRSGILTKNGMIVDNGFIDPHLLDILHLGATDPSQEVRNSAFRGLISVAFQDFTGRPDAYAAWHQQIAGQPVSDLVRDNCRAAIARLAKADATEKADLLALLAQVSFQSGLVPTMTADKGRVPLVIAQGLTEVRRKTALEAGLLDLLTRDLRPDNSPAINSKALSVLLNFAPEETYLQSHEADIRRVIAPMLTDKADSRRYQAVRFLVAVKQPWATDLLLKTVVETYTDPLFSGYINFVYETKDPRCIPTLIALLEAETGGETMQRAILATLSQWTGERYDPEHDGDWWHAWWEKNKGQFTPEVQALPFPKIPGVEKMFSLQRKKTRLQIANDPQRAYWLFSAGYLGARTRPQPPAAAAPNPNRPATDASERPGLLVVLADGDGDARDDKTRWQQVASKALSGSYLIARVIAPRWSAQQPTAWVTSANRARFKEAAFTTESFVADVVKDVQARCPIDSERIFLIGQGESGLAAYACSLEPQTPFKGFYIRNGAFRSSQLPALTHARGRRYLIEQSQDDKTTPSFLATAAQALLTKAGATVKRSTAPDVHGDAPDSALRKQIAQPNVHGDAPDSALRKQIAQPDVHGDALDSAFWKQIAQAVLWLEAGQP